VVEKHQLHSSTRFVARTAAPVALGFNDLFTPEDHKLRALEEVRDALVLVAQSDQLGFFGGVAAE
jgi:hypothetical protein